MKKKLGVIFFSVCIVFFTWVPLIFWNEVIAIPPNIQLFWNEEIELSVWDFFLEPWYLATDDIDGDISHYVKIEGNVDTNTVWEYVIYYNIINSQWLTNSRERKVKIRDNSAPKIFLYWKENIEILINTPYVDEWAYYIDNYYWTWFVEAIWKVDTTKVWENILTYRFTDPSWNTAIEIFRKVFVNTWNTPIITLLWDNPYYIEYKAKYIEPWFLVEDIEDKNLQLWNIFATWNIDTDTLWEYDISYYIWDSHWNIQFEQRRVIVADMTPPVITLKGADTVFIEMGSTYVDEWALWTDNYDGVWEITWTGNIDYRVAGEYKIEYNFLDSQLNVAQTKIRTIVVIDPSKFTIELLGESSINLEKYSRYIEYWAKAQDVFWNDISLTIKVEWKIDTTSQWIYNICYSVTESFLKKSKEVCRNIYVYDFWWWSSIWSNVVTKWFSLVEKSKKLHTYSDQWFIIWNSISDISSQEILQFSQVSTWSKSVSKTVKNLQNPFNDNDFSFSKLHTESLIKNSSLEQKNRKFFHKESLTRAEFLDLLFRIHKVDTNHISFSKIFKDLKDWTWQAKIGNTAYNLWITNWYVDGNFKPNNTISRIQAVKYVLKFNKTELADDTSYFIDVPVQWMVKYANTARKLWILEGEETPEGLKFYPEKNITPDEAIKLLYKSK